MVEKGDKKFIGVAFISILDLMSKGSMFFINQLNMMHGKLEKMNSIKDVERNPVPRIPRALLQRLSLLSPLLLHLQTHPSYSLQSHFTKLS
jgi:hypothetical protein